MAGYIGGKVAVSAPQQIETKHTITATASQTSIPNVGYTVGAVHVYQNGIRLVDGTDYTATNGSTVTLETGATEGDQIVIVSHGSFETSDTVSKASGGTFAAGITVNGVGAFGSGTTVGGAAVKVAGKETIWVPASAMQPTTSNGCSSLTTVETTSGRPDMVVLDFDKDSDEFAQFSVAFPKSWNEGTVTFQFFWSGLAATTGVVMKLEGVAVGNNSTIDVAYGTAVSLLDDAQGAVEELNVSAESTAVTIAGSPAVDNLCYFRVGRNVGDSNDDMAGDCRLHGVKLFFTTDAANDA